MHIEVLYLLLGERPKERAAWMSPALLVTDNPVSDGDSEAILWPIDDPRASNSPIAYLVHRARMHAWERVTRGIPKPLKQIDAWDSALKEGPEMFSRLGPSAFSIFGETEKAAVREARDAACRILDQKVAFVFPAAWTPTAGVSRLVRAMAKEVAEWFLDAPVNQEWPWTFLSMKADNQYGRQSPIGEFIQALHSELLSVNGKVDVTRWRQKSGAILLSGRTGSGKSYAARLLASHGKLVEVNLAAVTAEQLESRMRGYKAGTFTGGDKNGRAGWFEEANGGVLFLDEFQSVSVEAQVQLLDLLSAVSDDIYIARTGEDHERRRYIVKVILAVNEDVGTLLREKRLRRDIYYRVRHTEEFPSLKERLQGDIGYRYLRALLASYRWKSLRTIEQLNNIDGGALDNVPTFFPVFTIGSVSELVNQEWEGNFRELERVAFDLFYECDYLHKKPLFDKTDASSICARGIGQQISEITDGASEASQKKLLEIQQVLRECKFVICRALKAQAYYRSRNAMRGYLCKNIDKLAPDVRSDSRIINFLRNCPAVSD